MNSEMKVAVKCWSCEKKFTISSSDANPTIPIYRGAPPLPRLGEPDTRKKRILKICPYCGKDNEIELSTSPP